MATPTSTKIANIVDLCIALVFPLLLRGNLITFSIPSQLVYILQIFLAYKCGDVCFPFVSLRVPSPRLKRERHPFARLSCRVNF